MKYVYLVRAGEQHYKVGIATNTTRRLTSLQTSNPRKLDLITARLVANAVKVERQIHDQLRELGGDGGTEWFTLEPEEALTIAAEINRNPEIDVLANVEISGLLMQQAVRHKSLEKKLDVLINLHQSPAAQARAGIRRQPTEREAITITDRLSDDCRRAMDVFREAGKASTSLLQRKLHIGYGRASRVMDALRERGLIEHPTGSNGASKINEML